MINALIAILVLTQSTKAKDISRKPAQLSAANMFAALGLTTAFKKPIRVAILNEPVRISIYRLVSPRSQDPLERSGALLATCELGHQTSWVQPTKGVTNDKFGQEAAVQGAICDFIRSEYPKVRSYQSSLIPKSSGWQAIVRKEPLAHDSDLWLSIAKQANRFVVKRLPN